MRNAPFLILDEPTTGLDEANERAVVEALERLAQGLRAPRRLTVHPRGALVDCLDVVVHEVDLSAAADFAQQRLAHQRAAPLRHEFDEVVFDGIHRIESEFLGKGDTVVVHLGHQHLRAFILCNQSDQHPDRTAADDHNMLACFHLTESHVVASHRSRLDERAIEKRHAFRKLVQRVSRNRP